VEGAVSGVGSDVIMNRRAPFAGRTELTEIGVRRTAQRLRTPMHKDQDTKVYDHQACTLDRDCIKLQRQQCGRRTSGQIHAHTKNCKPLSKLWISLEDRMGGDICRAREFSHDLDQVHVRIPVNGFGQAPRICNWHGLEYQWRTMMKAGGVSSFSEIAMGGSAGYSHVAKHLRRPC
jgi:hypothetical protein